MDRSSETERLKEFARQAGAGAEAIGRNEEAVEVEDRNRYERLGDLLEGMLKFDEFSLVEYRYRIPGKREPGIRFKVTGREGKRRIVAVYFHDLVFWQVNERGEREFMELCEFDLSGETIVARPNPALSEEYLGCTDWESALRQTMSLPFRHLYQPDWQGVKPGVFSYHEESEGGESHSAGGGKGLH